MAPPAASAIAVRQATAADAPAIADLAAELGYQVGADDVRQRLTALPTTHIVLVATGLRRISSTASVVTGTSSPSRRLPDRSHSAEDCRVPHSQRRCLLRSGMSS